MAGPMPRANSFTRTPQALAVRKCPNSWTNISTPNIKAPTSIYTNVDIASPFRRLRRLSFIGQPHGPSGLPPVYPQGSADISPAPGKVLFPPGGEYR